MRAAGSVKADGLSNVCQRKVVKINPKGAKTECVFADDTSILVSNFLASFIRAGDELLFPLEHEVADAGTQIYIRKTHPEERRSDVFQAEIGYATQPRKDERNDLFVAAEVPDSELGISAINLRCEALRDYFYVANRCRGWDRQSSFYELLRVNPNVSPAELRLAFKLRTLELGTAHAPTGDLHAVNRAFNILARPELRACYDALLDDPTSPALFPYGGFGSLLVAGDLSRDGSTFHASRILSFLPDQKFKHFRAPLRRVAFYNDHAIYRDSRRKLEVLFDQTSLPLLWDSSWNQWKRLLGTKIGVKATFIQSGKYQQRAGAWHLAQWETALPSRIEVALPSSIAEQIAEARKIHHRFGEFSEALDLIRIRIESAPVERAALQKLCAELGMPADFDISRITWKPDYDDFYYKQLSERARRLYLFQSEYIFDLERAVIAETPQLGHATYLFSKPVNMTEFLTIYGRVAREDIRHNRGNVAERLGFLGRLVHGLSPQGWLRELKVRLGETVDYAPGDDCSAVSARTF
jgi:curved DNA-binding protein CbpA